MDDAHILLNVLVTAVKIVACKMLVQTDLDNRHIFISDCFILSSGPWN